MDNQPVNSAAQDAVAAQPGQSVNDVFGGAPAVDGAPQQDQQTQDVAPQIDFDAEKTRWEQQLQEREQQLQRVAAERDQVIQAAQRQVQEDAARQRAAKQADLARKLDQGDIEAAQYRAEIERDLETERRQLREQFETMSLPYMVQGYAQQAGLSADEMKQLEGVPPQAVDWTIQRIIADRQAKQEWEQKFDQLQKSVQAQGVVQQGVTRGVAGGGGGSPAEYESGSLGHLREALSALGHADILGRQ